MKALIYIFQLLLIILINLYYENKLTLYINQFLFINIRNRSIKTNNNENNFYKDVYENFKKPVNSNRNYRYLKLENELQVFLISNPNITKSAAFMHVGVGSANEPIDLPGLAHYLEHLLFINTKKYPELDGFMKFIGIRNGYTNAHTMDDRTVYGLEIDSLFYKEALDRFSSFFKNPLFNDTYTYKELMAVENEFNYARDTNEKRFKHILMELSDKRSLFNKFSFGNLETLRLIPESKGINVRNEVIKFYNKEYSSNRMILLLASNYTLDELSEFAIEYFSEIENKKLKVQSYFEPIQNPSFNPLNSLTKKFILINSSTEDTILNLIFPLKRYMSSYKLLERTFYLYQFIYSKRKGGLYHYLYNNNLIFDINLSIQDESIGFSYFLISIQLTKKGESNITFILESIFSITKLLNNTKPNINIYNQFRQVLLNEFNYGDTLSLFDEGKNLLTNYYQYNCKPEDALIEGYLLNDFNINIYNEILSQIIPENMLITLQYKNFDELILNSNSNLINIFNITNNIHANNNINNNTMHVDSDNNNNNNNNNNNINISNEYSKINYEYLISSNINNSDIIHEHYTKAKYVFKDLNLHLIDHLKQIDYKLIINELNITYPEENPYISENFSNVLLSVKKEKLPIRLENAIEKYKYLNNIEFKKMNYYNEYKDLFYYPTHEINTPKAVFIIKLIFPLDKIIDNSIDLNLNSRQLEMLSFILSSLLLTKLSQEMYQLELASYFVSISNDVFSENSLTTIELLFVTFGFSDKISKVIFNLSKFIGNFINNINESDFYSQIQIYENQLLNMIYNPQFSDNYKIMYKNMYYNQNLSPEIQLKELRNLKFDHLIKYYDYFIKYSKLQGFIYGNITPIQVAEIMEDFSYNIKKDNINSNDIINVNNKIDFYQILFDKFRFLLNYIYNIPFNYNQYDYDYIPKHLISTEYIDKNKDTIDNLQVLDLMSLKKNSKIYYYLLSNFLDDLNSAIILDVAIGYNSLRNSILTKLLVSIISDHFFTELRTEKQSGYIVTASYKDLVGHISGISFIVVSSNKDVRILSEDVLEFWEKWFSNQYHLIDLSMFESSKSSYIQKLKEPQINFLDTTYQFSKKIFNKEYENLDWKEKTIYFLNNLTFEEFMKWFEKLYFNSNLFMFAIQSSNHKYNDKLDFLNNYIPSNFTRYNSSEPLFQIPNIKVYNQMQIFNID